MNEIEQLKNEFIKQLSPEKIYLSNEGRFPKPLKKALFPPMLFSEVSGTSFP